MTATAAAVEYTQDDLLDRSPTLLRLSKKRLAPARLSQLLAAARGKKPPQEPELTDCCGSSCRPCVRDLWKEENKVWGEINPDGASDGEEEDGEAGDEKGEKEEEGKKTGRGAPMVEIGLEDDAAPALTPAGVQGDATVVKKVLVKAEGKKEGVPCIKAQQQAAGVAPAGPLRAHTQTRARKLRQVRPSPLCAIGPAF
ncbi:hypothetical protein JCM6882_006984 [Rhodosporidiobolus microsporus]